MAVTVNNVPVCLFVHSLTLSRPLSLSLSLPPPPPLLFLTHTLSLHAGQGLINLESLETKSELQQVVDLMDEKGRKQVGGKLEVAARLREPLTGRLST